VEVGWGGGGVLLGRVDDACTGDAAEDGFPVFGGRKCGNFLKHRSEGCLPLQCLQLFCLRVPFCKPAVFA